MFDNIDFNSVHACSNNFKTFGTPSVSKGLRASATSDYKK